MHRNDEKIVKWCRKQFGGKYADAVQALFEYTIGDQFTNTLRRKYWRAMQKPRHK